MLEEKTINEMVVRRRELYESVSDMGVHGFRTEPLVNVVTQSIATAISCPSFLFDTHPPLFQGANPPVLDGKWKLPFDKFSVVVGSMPRNGKLVVVYERPPVESRYADRDVVRATIIARDKRWGVSISLSVIVLPNGMFSGGVIGADTKASGHVDRALATGLFHPDIKDLDSYWMYWVGIVMTLLHAVLVAKEVRFRGAPSTTRTPMQEAKSKSPYWQYHMVKPKTIKGTVTPLGGHHATPVEHDVRGHERHLSSGKTLWINSFKRGDPSKGRVDKDYDL